MERVQSFLASGAKPSFLLTPEEDAKLAAEERRANLRHRLKLAGIPERYMAARLSESTSGAVRGYAESIGRDGKLSKTGPWLVIAGNNGTRKTEDACAVLNEFIEFPVRFASMSSILGEISDSYVNRTSSESIIKRYAGYRLLVIDDFGKERPTEYNVAQFFRILNDRYNRRKPTIITTNYSSEELAAYLTVDGNDEAARAILDRIISSENVFDTRKGRSVRRGKQRETA